MRKVLEGKHAACFLLTLICLTCSCKCLALLFSNADLKKERFKVVKAKPSCVFLLLILRQLGK